MDKDLPFNHIDRSGLVVLKRDVISNFDQELCVALMGLCIAGNLTRTRRKVYTSVV